jgi:hypothetical protein
MTTMIDLPTDVVDPMLAAELLRRRWQERPAYFSHPQARPTAKLHVMWQRQPGRIAPAMRWSAPHAAES